VGRLVRLAIRMAPGRDPRSVAAEPAAAERRGPDATPEV